MCGRQELWSWVPFLITWHRVEFASEEMIFFKCRDVDFVQSWYEISSFVPLLRSVVSSDGRLMEVKLWTLLVGT